MDQDMEVAEIRFAETLCSCLPKTRRRALNKLHSFIKKQSQKKEFTPESFDRLCRGLHYALWMQDKMLLQEELSDEFGSLIHLFETNGEVNEFMRSMLRTLSRHWLNIDKWRVDKFLQLVRRLFRSFFVYLHDKNWRSDYVEDAILFLRQTVITVEDGGVCESLKLHFASIYVEELDFAGDLDKEQLLNFLKPYVLLMEKKMSNHLFGAICTEVFGTILEGFAAELEQNHGNSKVSGDLETKGKPIEFDYAAIANELQKLFDSELMNVKRKKRIRLMVQQFQRAVKNENPFAEIEEPNTQEPITNEMISKAADKLHSLHSKAKRDKKQFTKIKKTLRKTKVS